MAVVRLTEAAWLEYESGRVQGVLLVHLGRAGTKPAKLVAWLREQGLVYTADDLVLIQAKLIADGVLELA